MWQQRTCMLAVVCTTDRWRVGLSVPVKRTCTKTTPNYWTLFELDMSRRFNTLLTTAFINFRTSTVIIKSTPITGLGEITSVFCMAVVTLNTKIAVRLPAFSICQSFSGNQPANTLQAEHDKFGVYWRISRDDSLFELLRIRRWRHHAADESS